MKNYLDKHVQLYKLCCDGLDLINRIDLFDYSEIEISYAKKHCVIDSFGKLPEFYTYCIEERIKNKKNYFGLSDYLLDKYEVGYYKVQYSLNFHPNYILFSDENINKWENMIPLTNLEFMVCFSRNWNGEFNGIGMRILDTKLVSNAFKWLFPMGQKCTFGLHTCSKNKELILVEGFTDMIAGKESGYNNCVGLGSVEITEQHKKELKTNNYIFCPDQDSYGMELRKEFGINCLFSPHNYKDPYDAFLNTGTVCFHKISDGDVS